MSTIIEKFETTIIKSWKNAKKIIPNNGLTKKTIFELAYHHANDVPLRCIKTILKAGEDDAGNEAILFSGLDKTFFSILGTQDAVEITMFSENDASLTKLNDIVKALNDSIAHFKKRSDLLKDQIVKTILIERKIDEVVNSSSNKDLARKVYFAIGETRERGALIPLMMYAKSADVVQLAIMKWMNSALNDNQDAPFPEAKVRGLIKNFLQIKKWIIDLINKAFVAPEAELLKSSGEVVDDKGESYADGVNIDELKE
jgi:hypothetical protein